MTLRPPAPADVTTTHEAWHRLTEHTLSPVRVEHDGGETTLVATPTSLATPEFEGSAWRWLGSSSELPCP